MRDPLDETRRWVEDFVVRHDLCPFAAGPLKAGALRLAQVEGAEVGPLLEALVDEMQALSLAPSPSTTLLVWPEGPEDFEDFLDLVAACEDLLARCGYEGALQLVAFHPRWRFAEGPPDDPAHAVQRSPYPTLHLLRWDDVRRASTHHPDIEAVPTRNAALLRELAGWS